MQYQTENNVVFGYAWGSWFLGTFYCWTKLIHTVRSSRKAYSSAVTQFTVDLDPLVRDELLTFLRNDSITRGTAHPLYISFPSPGYHRLALLTMQLTYVMD